jgi:hypothetical protein
MRSIIISFSLLILFKYSAEAQVSGVIENLKISYYNLEQKYNDFNEDHWSGPEVSIDCAIINFSKKDVLLHPSKDSIFIVFNYQGKDYNDLVISFFQEKDKLTLKPGESVEFNVSSRILLGTDLYQKPDYDYRDVLLQIIPTLKVCYIIAGSGERILSKGINRVSLIN